MDMENVFGNIITVNNISFCHGLFKRKKIGKYWIMDLIGTF